jgi:hypothetical protein
VADAGTLAHVLLAGVLAQAPCQPNSARSLNSCSLAAASTCISGFNKLPLVDRLTKILRRRPDRIRSGSEESGYAASGIVLLVAMFESYLSRLRFVQSTKARDSHRGAMDVVLSIFPRLRHRKALADVYVLRDAMMHAHLWEIEYESGGAVPFRLLKATMHSAYGDNKFEQRVNAKTLRTRALGLSILPLRIDRSDLLKVFEAIWKTLQVFEAADRFQCYVSDRHIRYRGKTVLFSSLINELRRVR